MKSVETRTSSRRPLVNSLPRDIGRSIDGLGDCRVGIRPSASSAASIRFFAG
jgi:hypothetical protein